MKPKLYTFNGKGEKVPIKLVKVGDADFECVNCGRIHHRTLWEHHDEDDDEYGANLVAGYANCPCGASLMVADDMEGFAVYWLNEREMKGILGENTN